MVHDVSFKEFTQILDQSTDKSINGPLTSTYKGDKQIIEAKVGIYI